MEEEFDFDIKLVSLSRTITGCKEMVQLIWDMTFDMNTQENPVGI